MKLRKKTEKLADIAMLSATCIALRMLFAELPNVQPIFAIFFCLATTFSLSTSLLTMGITMLATSFLLGFGIWVPMQIISLALLIVMWFSLQAIFKNDRYQLLLAGFLSFLYGLLMAILSAPVLSVPILTYWVSGLSFDGLTAISTMVFFPIIDYLFRRIIKNEKMV